MTETEYGYWRTGALPVVVVVPHGGDPAERGAVEVAERLRRLDIGLVVNTRLRRRKTELNRAPEPASSSAPVQLHFWADIRAAVTAALNQNAVHPVVVLSVHNAMPLLTEKSFLFPRRNPRTRQIEPTPVVPGTLRPWDLDIGAGYSGLLSAALLPAMELESSAKDFCRDLVPAGELCPDRGLGGAMTCPRSLILNLVIAARRMMPDWRVEVGLNYPAQNPRNLVQTVFSHFRESGRLSTVQLEFREELPVSAVFSYLEHLVVEDKIC